MGQTRCRREHRGAEKPKAPTTALAVKVKPVIPGVPGMAKLPNGWRMVTGADGKP